VDKDEMILVSVDDHVIEPPDMFERHLPKKWADAAPRVVTEGTTNEWIYRGKPAGLLGLNAVVGWPPLEWNSEPSGFAEMRPGAYDIHARVRDMDRNGVLASMCFPTFAGFSGGHLSQFRDETTTAVIQAYNDWHIDEWCGTYPGRFIPLAIAPIYDPEAAAAEIRRVAAKGARGIAMPEMPHIDDLPSYHDEDYWRPIWTAMSETGLPMTLHIGMGLRSLTRAPGAPRDHSMILACQVTAHAAQDLLWGPAYRNYPDLKFSYAEGGIGWVPFYLDRCDRHYTNQKWLRRDFGGKLPSQVFLEQSLACFVTDPHAVKSRHEVGMDIIAWECDYPHSDSIWPDAPEWLEKEFSAADCTDAEIHKMTWENGCRFYNWDPFAEVPRERATVGGLRALATDVDTTIRGRGEWAELYRQAHAPA
jgi:predicted TIM-barrel fold metal-dependent hydrolase